MTDSLTPVIGDYVAYHGLLGQIIHRFTGPNDLEYVRVDVEGDRSIVTQVRKLTGPTTLWHTEN